MANHLRRQNDHLGKYVTSTILEVIQGDLTLDQTTAHRKLRERFWIYQLSTLAPLGINTQG